LRIDRCRSGIWSDEDSSAGLSTVRIMVPPSGYPLIAASGAPPSTSEAWRIVMAIQPAFDEYASRYDTSKYWPDVYERVAKAFRRPRAVTPEVIRDAFLWKFGHLGKQAIPGNHERLISEVQRGWPSTVAA